MVQRQKVVFVVIIMMVKEMMMTFNVDVDDHDELKSGKEGERNPSAKL